MAGNQISKTIEWVLLHINGDLLRQTLGLQMIATNRFMNIFPTAVKDSNYQVVKLILYFYPDHLQFWNSEVLLRNEIGTSALQEYCMSVAVRNEDHRMIKVLCEAGFSPFIRVKYVEFDNLPWRNANLEVLQLLLDYGADLET